MDYKDKTVALIGYGIENQASYRYFDARGAIITICDQNSSLELPEGSQGQLGDEYLDNLDRFDVIVRSVGIPPSVILDPNPGVGDKITTAVNIFFEECKTPILGVTGTKGKGTTTTLIHKILEAAGKKSLLAGNIGLPMLDILDQAQNCDIVALELSSFQLSDLRHSPHIAVCLMVVPEHLNWHADMDDYKGAKQNMFRYQKSDDVAIFNALSRDSQEIAAVSPATNKLSYAVPDDDSNDYDVYVSGDAIYYRGQEICKISDVKLLGRHNLQNVCAAIAATWDMIDGNTEAVKSALASFTGLEFRLELIREFEGVRYYNDSFSTTPETAIAALRSFEEPKVVILGGSDKGIPFDELVSEVTKNNVKHVISIGDTASAIATKLQKLGYDNITLGLKSMPEITTKAHELADSGDIVLLSTGCASFDMFKDYKDRGNQFNQAVLELS